MLTLTLIRRERLQPSFSHLLHHRVKHLKQYGLDVDFRAAP